MKSNKQTLSSFSSDSNEMYFNYRHFMDFGRKCIKNGQPSYGDFFLCISLLCPNIDLLSYLESLSMRSYIYYSLKDSQMLLVLSSKILELFPEILLIEETRTLSDVIKILNRAGLIMIEASQQRTIIPFYLLSKAKQLLESNKHCKLNENDLKLFEKSYEDAKNRHLRVLNNDKKVFENVINIKTSQFISDKKNELYQILEEHVKNIGSDFQGDTIKPGEEVYLISNKWLKNYKQYLAKMLSIKDSPNDYIIYLNKAFDINKQCDCFIESEGIEGDNTYIGPVNNFWITKRTKEQWYGPVSSYINDYIKPSLETEKYSIVSKDQWNEITEDFEYINSIKRFKLPSGEIEIHLKEIKVMVLDKNIIAKSPLLTYPRSMQVSKLFGTYETIIETVYSILKKKRPQYYCMYEIDIHNMKKDKRKQMLIELMLAYSLDFNDNNIILEGKLIENVEQSAEAIPNKSLIIIETMDDSNGDKAFIQLNNIITAKTCGFCGQMANLIPCTKCKIHIINKKYYCNPLCQRKDKQHHQYHNYMSKFISFQYTLPAIRSMPLAEVIEYNIPESLKGLVGFRNLGNTCFLNSALQCLSHCEDLTKFFLLKQYKSNINSSEENNNNTNGEIAKAYYNLIKQLWLGDQCVLSPSEFKGIFSHFVQQFADQNQHDSQEALTFILDKIHEDLNKIHKKPYIEMNSHNSNDTDKEASDKWWKQYKRREDSIIVDLFHGQFKNKIICSHCKNQSMTFDPFVFLSLPIPSQNFLIQYKFFPLLNFNYPNPSKMKKNNRNKNNNKNRVSNHKPTITFVYKAYELSLSNRTIINDFILPIISDNSTLSESLLFDFILLKPNKEFHKIILTSKQLTDSFDDLLNGYELCIYERQDIIQNVFVYPCDFIQIRKWHLIPDINVQFLSYPLAIPMSNEEHVQDLYNKLNTYFQPIFSIEPNSNQQYLHMPVEESHYSNRYSLFLYNTNYKKIGWFSMSNLLKYLADYEVNNDESIQCDFCGNIQCLYCNFLSRFGQNESFDYIFSICSLKSPLIIYAQIFNYNRSKRLYANTPIPLTINKTIPVSHNKVISIYDCLDLFTTEEYLDEDNKWYCPKCKTHQQANKRLDLFTVPPYLIIQLKRFQSRSGFGFGFGRKNFTFIDFPLESLDLGKYMQNTSGGKTEYDLIGISEHYGQLSSGHYVSECLNNGNWYEFDDNSVTKKSKDNISKRAAYILFYKQK